MTDRTASFGRRRTTVALGLACVLGAGGCAATARNAPTATAARPNIVVIMADDMGYSDIGPYGGEIRTPNLDRLAAGGLRFRQFYNTAKCTTTRASLLTGLYPSQAGIGGGVGERGKVKEPGPFQGYLSPQLVTVPEALRAAGYRTYMSGKWHVGEDPENWPRRHGFDRYFGLISGASSYFELLQQPGRVRQMVLEDSLWTPPLEGFYMTDAFTAYAVERIREHGREHPSRPFFLYLAYTAPHWPLHAPREDIARYDGRYDTGWERLREERYARMRELGILTERYSLAPRPATVPAWEEMDDKAEWAGRMEVHAAMVDRMDQGIGRLLRVLEETGMSENTLILFLSDNGASAEGVDGRDLHDPAIPVGARGSYASFDEPWAYAVSTPFRLYKTWLHEGGTRTPAIAYWPAGIHDPGRITDEVAHVMDLMPTALELAGAPFPATQDDRSSLAGRSFAPALAGEPAREREALFWSWSGNRAVRQGDWKLVYDSKLAKRWELYDLAGDPTELNDQSAEEPERVEALRALWDAWAHRVGVQDRSVASRNLP